MKPSPSPEARAEGARDLRARALARLLNHVDADVAGFWSLTDSDGRVALRSFQTVGHASESEMSALWASEVLPHLPITPGRLRPVETRAFLEDEVLRLEGVPWDESRLFNRYFLPLGLESQIRLLVEEGGLFYGYVGLLRRRGRKRFSRHDRRLLAPVVAATRAAIIASAGKEERLAPGHVVCTQSGGVENACIDGARWLDVIPAASLRAVVAQAAERTHASMDAGVARLRATRVDGAQVRFIVHIEALTLPRDPLAALTPMQREVVRAAARGEPVARIGARIDRSAETVRSHLREAYRRLGVRTRLELATLLKGDPT